MDLVAVRDGDRVLYVETGRIREIVIHPQLHKVPGAPGNVGGVLIYEGKPLTFYCLGNGNEISCAFILGGQDDALCAVCGEPVGEETGIRRNWSGYSREYGRNQSDQTECKGI